MSTNDTADTSTDSTEAKPTSIHYSIHTRRIINTSDLNKLLKENSSHGLCGSHNLGNTCFMNSSIACLSNCIELTTYFLTEEFKKDLNKDNPRGLGGKLAIEWYKLLYEYWIENNRTGNPSSFKSTIGKKAHRFRGYGQQDSNEFMTFFLDYINEDLNKVTNAPYEEIQEQKDNESDLDCANRFWNLHLRRNDSIITDLFSGQYKNIIECPDCHWKSITYVPFNTLILPIPNKPSIVKKNITFFFIPKYSMRSTVKIMARLNENIKFCEVANEIKNIEDFNYDVENLSFIEVSDKQCVGICDKNDGMFDNNEHYFFCSEDDKEYKKIIMLYISTENKNDLSAYPRIFYTGENMSFNEFKMRIYFYARHYILDPFGKEDDEDEFKKIFNEYCKNEHINEEKVVNYMKEEYIKIFENPTEENKELIDKFMNDLPFEFLITNDKNSRIDLLKIQSIEEKLNELNFISESQTEIGKLLDFMEKENHILLLKFNSNSSYIKQSNLKFNTCSNVRMASVQENNYYNYRYQQQYTLKECFECFTSEETLGKGNEWYCHKCKSFKRAKKKMELFYLPKLFIICLKRFSGSNSYWGKNDALIEFPINNMDMKDFVCGPDKEYSKYDLFAVSQHYGGCGGGHYTAICKNFGKWYNYNDSSVSKGSENDVVSSAAYVLFYRRTTD